MTVDGFCQCQLNYVWNFVTHLCEDCTTITNMSICASGQCINYFVQGNSCKKCPSNTIFRPSNTLPTACLCGKGYIWLPLTSLCIICDSTTSIVSTKSNKCVACSDILNAAASPLNNYECNCNFNYVFIDGSCTCNATMKLYDLGGFKGCGNCSQVIGGTTYNSSTKGCNCISGAAWNS